MANTHFETSMESRQMKEVCQILDRALSLINNITPNARALIESEWCDIEEARDSIARVAREVE